MVASMNAEHPLLVVVGPTASGKSSLSLQLAEQLNGEIISCDSVAVYRMMDIGAAKPSAEERARVPHHCIDTHWPNEPCTAGDYARMARAAIADITARGKLPIVAGGTGLYLRATLEGLAPAPQRDEDLRERLRQGAAARPPGYLHRLLARLDAGAAATIHPNDAPKLIRAIEVSLVAHTPQTEQWKQGRDPLTGYQVLQIGLTPPRAQLYEHINHRAAHMFDRGLVAETREIVDRFGSDCRALTSLGYAQAISVLRDELSLSEAIAIAQQGHRNYAKRQLTWFRRDLNIHWLPNFGTEPNAFSDAIDYLEPRI
jgi:tRNA dimethylallyltransferase